jgi:hypothetical protein
VHVCEAPEEIDISPDGHEAWVGCRHSNEIGRKIARNGRNLANCSPNPDWRKYPAAAHRCRESSGLIDEKPC